ncbi:hypothetical protein [Vibrio apostichopi]|uniref:hypothetical protein n=1 Tax=Vibrio apostichopi TaxID=3035453 RepID=UPI0025747234|nr:hypothetical protein [Vibrio sp. FE10]
MDVWFLVTAISFVVCLIATLVSLVTNVRFKVTLSWSCLALLTVTLFLSQKYTIRDLLSDRLVEDSFVISSIEEVDEASLLSALKNKEYLDIYRTKPTVKNKVRIIARDGELQLILAKDSVHDDVYWVYYPKYRFSRINDIGKIRLD